VIVGVSSSLVNSAPWVIDISMHAKILRNNFKILISEQEIIITFSDFIDFIHNYAAKVGVAKRCATWKNEKRKQ